ncbi:hypothetical protein [Streptomyces flavidovirens]|uniref:hypothetical protein n=1 Tax=Streptomyces flavidovirens TaxID=67298 RepID=UPI000422EB5F|nr:hypothetical protein [Streptomyces flavidovirens]
MAATLPIPVYLRVGNGSETQIGEVVVSVDSTGMATLTLTDIAAALRATANEMDARMQEDTPDAPA